MAQTAVLGGRLRRLALIGCLLLAAFAVVGTAGAADHQHAFRALDALAVVLVVAGPLALTAMLRWPSYTVGLVVSVTIVYFARGYAYGPVIVAPAVALFAAVVMGHRALAWLGFAALYVGHLVVRFALVDDSVSWGQLLGVAAWGVVILFAAEIARVRRERIAAAVTARREASRRQANEERLRIARELHDVVAHHMSLINVQAGVALHLVDRKPEQVETALAVIKEASKEALVELRSLVGMLRDEAEEAPRAPTAMLDSVDDLVRRSALAGLTVHVRVDGEPIRLPAAVDLAAWRIVQESVTNVVRHAGAQTAEVTLVYDTAELRVCVDDDGHGLRNEPPGGAPWEVGTGSGLRGMQERASALGGALYVERAPVGGVRVRAVLPVSPVEDEQ